MWWRCCHKSEGVADIASTRNKAHHKYGEEHTAKDLLAKAVYGLPEVNREQIRDAQLLACPGCYPTSVQLGFAP